MVGGVYSAKALSIFCGSKFLIWIFFFFLGGGGGGGGEGVSEKCIFFGYDDLYIFSVCHHKIIYIFGVFRNVY